MDDPLCYGRRVAASLALLITVVCVVAPSAGARARWHKPPKPPVVRYVHGVPPGWEPTPSYDVFRAGAAGDTIYWTRRADRFDMAHERGHVFDWEILSGPDRSYFKRMWRLIGEWTPEGDCNTEVQCPDEWFADWYGNARVWLRSDGLHGWTIGYADGPTSDRQFRRFLWRVRLAYSRRSSHR